VRRTAKTQVPFAQELSSSALRRRTRRPAASSENKQPICTKALHRSWDDDSALVTALVRGIEGASQCFIARHHVFFRSAVLSSSPAAWSLVEDLIHDVYVHLWRDDFRALRRWRREHPLRAYLRTVISRLTWDRLSQLQPDQEQLEGDALLAVGTRLEHMEELTTPEDDAAANELLQMVHSALDCLNDNYRQILELRYFHELSYIEISSAIGITPTNAGVRITRALAHLKLALPQLIDGADCFSMRLPAALLRCNKIRGSSVNRVSKGGAAS
jgi:RNA polymerase sigma factor (sigma-70 family)